MLLCALGLSAGQVHPHPRLSLPAWHAQGTEVDMGLGAGGLHQSWAMIACETKLVPAESSLCLPALQNQCARPPAFILLQQAVRVWWSTIL